VGDTGQPPMADQPPDSSADAGSQAARAEQDGDPALPDSGPEPTGVMAPTGGNASRAPRRRPAVRPLRILATAALVVVILVVAAGWVGYRAVTVSDRLGTAARLFSQLQQQLEGADLASARTTLGALQREVRAAREQTDGPAWGLASASPKLGDDMAAVRTVSGALDDLVSTGLPPLIDVAGALQAALLDAKGGPIDLGTVQAAAGRLVTAQTVIQDAGKRVADIRTAGLAPQIQARIPSLIEGLRRAEEVAGPAGLMARLLPPMLGGTGPRTYLVLFQNLAEARATGGMPGAFAVLQADRGAITMIEQGTASGTLKTFPAPVLPLDPDMADLHTDRLGMFPADVNLTPDFPTAAVLAREMYRLRSGRTVDGVIATDPVALSYLLAATGPVPMPVGEPLTSANAVRTLLSTVYATLPEQARQDAYFASAAKGIFEVLLGRRADPQAALAALVRAGSERRLLMWSAHPEEQREIEGTMLGGQLPADDGATPMVGVFLNDGSGAKLGYYLTRSATLAVGECLEDGIVELRLTVVIGSTAPRSGLPRDVLGMGVGGDPYTVRTNVMVYSPTNGALVDATVNGAPVDVGTGVEGNRSVAVLTVDLPPGVTKTLDATLLTDALPPSGESMTTPRLWTTPGVSPWALAVAPGPGCRK